MSMKPFNQHYDYGVVEKCPHCDRTNVPRTTLTQFTCGSASCRNKQNNLRRRLNHAKAKRKAASSHV